MPKNIVLVGFMGVGKSSVGRVLARRLGYRFIDTDQAIEKITGLTVEMIFRRHGPIRFRSEETLLLQRLLGQSGLVISTGGGMLLKEENVRLLRQNGILIGLRAEPEIIIERVGNKKDRPLLKKNNVAENVHKLLKEREGVYDVAEFTVDTGLFSPEESVNEIIKYLREKGY
ncbi:MAG: shikimate kinase [Firmicutes bacterium]|nr:shikimate kinase [Bacillota bacterium]